MKKLIYILIALLSLQGFTQNPDEHPDGVIVGGGATDGTGKKAGQIKWDSDDLKFRKYNGSAWSDLIPAAGAEINDLSAAVTWTNVPDANITESSVTQHEAALSIGISQVTGITLANLFDTTTDDSDDITEGASNLFLTSAERTILSNTSGTNTGDQDLSDYQLEPSEGAFVDGDKTKLDGIETGAEANDVDSVNSETGAVVLTPDEIPDRTLTNASVATTQALDYEAYEQFDFTLTDAVTFSESNVYNKVIIINCTGDYAITYPANWSTNITGAYDGTVQNTIVVWRISSGVYKVQITQPD